MKKTYTLTLTQACNLSCIYCYEHGKTSKAMSLDTGKSIIRHAFNDADPEDSIVIDFFGGEPFLEFELMKQLVQFAEELYQLMHGEFEYLFFATTNGTLVHGEVKEWLKNHPNVVLGLSLDGTKEMHDINRCNSFDSIDYEFFVSLYPLQHVKMTISQRTLDYLAEGVIFLHSKGFKVSCNLAYGIDWSDMKFATALNTQLDRLIEYYLDNPEQEPAMILRREISAAGKYKKSTYIPKWCGVGTAMHTFDVDGTVYPCQFFMPVSIGEKLNIAKDIVFSEEIDVMKLDKKCQECIVCQICPTCYGSNFLDSGNIYHKSDDQCRMERIIFRANAMFAIRKWDRGLLNSFEEEVYWTLKGAKMIINSF